MAKLLPSVSQKDFINVIRELDGWRFDEKTCQYFPKDNLKGWKLYVGAGLPPEAKPLLGVCGNGPVYGNHPETGSQSDELITAFFVDERGDYRECCVVYEQLLSAVNEAAKVRKIYNGRLHQ